MFARLKPNAVTQSVVCAALRTYFRWSFLIFVILFLALIQAITKYAGEHEIDTKDICSLLLTYNSLVLSFSLAAMTLVVAMPSHDFVMFLAKERNTHKGKLAPFRNLILSFFQAAFAHYISLALAAILFMFSGDKIRVNALISFDGWFVLVSGAQTWAFLMFGFALKDIASLGVLYANYLAKAAANNGHGNAGNNQGGDHNQSK
jgi:hypothetical protein